MIALLDKSGGYVHDVYNVAQGEAVTLGHLLELCRVLEPILPGRSRHPKIATLYPTHALPAAVGGPTISAA
jgi:hypothetical protein